MNRLTDQMATVVALYRQEAVAAAEAEAEVSEHWLPVPSYEGFYEVSDLGRVRSVPRLVPAKHAKMRRAGGLVLRPGISKHGGYPLVSLRRDGRIKSFFVHRLVLLAFVGPPSPGQECCHNNGIATDCRLANLRWDTRSGNVRDTIAHGTAYQQSKTHCPRGHEYTPDNTAVWSNGKGGLGGRNCRTCKRERQRSKRVEA